MNPLPNPTRRDASIQNVDRTPYIRKLHCALQSACLKVAADGGWQGMSCEWCEVELSLTRDEMRSDLEAMSRMWAHA